MWFDCDNTLYLKWWNVNDGIKGKQIKGAATSAELRDGVKIFRISESL